MNRHKTTAGIAVLLALALGAFTAASAPASGSTAFTCVKGAGKLIGAHCLPGSTGEYGHVAIEPNTTTTGTVTNANTAEETKAARSTIIQATLSGVATEITCKEVNGEGTFENRTTAGGEMYAHTEGILHFTGCVVKKPAEKGCKVAGETITTEQLTATTQEQEDSTKFQPASGSKFADVKIEGCSVAALNNTFPVTGSAKSAASAGATLTVTHTEVTTQGTLKFGGQKAGIDGALTFKGHSKAGEETNPLAVTTTP